MRKFLLTFSFCLGFLAFTSLPVTAKTGQDSSMQQQDKKKDNKKEEKKKTETVTFKTTIHCEGCVQKVNENISFERGVKDLKVSLDNKQVTITFDPSKTDQATLAKAIEKLGYEVENTERTE